jgi:uncharacterized membrane protein YjjP (DUF1212 family)
MVQGNYSDMLIGLLIAILCFLARKITAGGARETQEFFVPVSAFLCALCG